MASDASCSFAGSGDQNSTDPMLGPLAKNGGATKTMALLPGSPAIDNSAPTCSSFDQRGAERTGTCDKGAYEYVSCLGKPATIVSSGGDPLIGTKRADVIAGHSISDLIKGLGGNDRICGGASDDVIIGGDGKDKMSGDGGTDVCNGGLGTDIATLCERP